MLNGNMKKKGKRTRKNKRPHGEEDKGNAQQADAHAEVEEVVLRTKKKRTDANVREGNCCWRWGKK